MQSVLTYCQAFHTSAEVQGTHDRLHVLPTPRCPPGKGLRAPGAQRFMLRPLGGAPGSLRCAHRAGRPQQMLGEPGDRDPASGGF